MIQQRADLSPRLTYSLTFPDKKSRYLRNFAKGSFNNVPSAARRILQKAQQITGSDLEN